MLKNIEKITWFNLLLSSSPADNVIPGNWLPSLGQFWIGKLLLDASTVVPGFWAGSAEPDCDAATRNACCWEMNANCCWWMVYGEPILDCGTSQLQQVKQLLRMIMKSRIFPFKTYISAILLYSFSLISYGPHYLLSIGFACYCIQMAKSFKLCK